MDTNSLQAAKKRSFHLPSFRRSSAGERPEPVRNAEEIARRAKEVAHVQKAAAWQWYTRGVGEAVVPTKRPPVGNSQALASDDKNGVNGRSKGGESIISSSNVQQKKSAEPPQASESPRAASRFKAEASFTRPTGSGVLPTPSAPSGGPSTPLYDDFDLFGLRTQMADFVQRLENQHSTKHNEQFPAVGDQQKSKPPPCPSTPSVSIDHQQTKAPPVVTASSSDHLFTTLPPASAVPVASTIPLHMRPFSALHRFFRKVVSGSIAKSTKNSPQLIDSPTAVYEPEVLIPEDQNDDTNQYHLYHHYIHHHHHHYHYAQSPEERAMVIRSKHRHSESSGVRPHSPRLWEAESDEEEAEGSTIKAYFAHRRRHSDSFPGQIQPKKADFDEDEGMKEESVKAALPMPFWRRNSSERFSPNKIPTAMVNREIGQPAGAGRKDGSFDEFLASRRTRHSAEYYREEASLERKADQGGGKSAGGAYKLGRAGGGGMQATPGGRKSPGGPGRAAGGGMQATPAVQRRHSEGFRRPEAAQYEMGKRSPSARYHGGLLPQF